METALAVCLDSFGSPLMRFTEYEGFVWHIGSQWSGTGKSLVLSAKAGVWGHPLRYSTGKSTSPVAMQQRAGLLNSMPLLIDEITNTQRKDMEWAPPLSLTMQRVRARSVWSRAPTRNVSITVRGLPLAP
jgi:uncharacterized protein (DUF927 family)